MIYNMTPVQKVGSIEFKRDDLFVLRDAPGAPNGGKLRSALVALERMKGTVCVTVSGANSPQAANVAEAARVYGKRLVVYTGIAPGSIEKYPMMALAARLGATFRHCPSGRHTVLTHRAKAERKGELVGYGVGSFDEEFVNRAVGAQTANIGQVDTLVIPCGSGIMSAGILQGLALRGQIPGSIRLYGTAPCRMTRIMTMLYRTLGPETAAKIEQRIVYRNLFDEPGFSYDRREPLSYHGIELHPQYEAKAMRAALQDGIESWPGRTLFWIVGAEPGDRGKT